MEMSGLVALVMGLMMVVMMGGMVWGVAGSVRRRLHGEARHDERGSPPEDRGAG
jgi:hypothetical protein